MPSGLVGQSQDAAQPTKPRVDEEEVRPLPVLSQGEHPFTRRPAYFVHPCETQTMLEEILSATTGPSDLDSDNTTSFETLKTWLMLVHSVVDLEGC